MQHTNLVLAIAFAVAAAPASSEEIWSFKSGNWEGSAHKNAEGSFSHCALAGEYKDGTTLAIGLTSEYQLRLAVSHPDWKIPNGQTYSVGLRIDKRDFGQFNSFANEDSVVVVQIEDRSDLWRALQTGKVLYVLAAKKPLSFELPGTSAALLKLGECVQLGTSLAGPTVNPFAGGESSRAAKANESGSDFDGREFVDALLSAAGMVDKKFIAPEPAGYKNAEHAWQSGGIEGAQYGFELSKVSGDELISGMVGAVAQDCKGKFASQLESARKTVKGVIKQLSAVCDGPGEGLTLVITEVEVGDTGLIFLQGGSNAVSGDLIRINKALGDVLDAFLSK